MPAFLLELGCEELPAAAVERAFRQLEHELVARLTSALLPPSGSRALGTPRRLIVGLEGLPERQPDQHKRQRGPGLKAAYDSEGRPTKALEGFCRSQGVSVDQLVKEDDYVWVDKTIAGRPAAEVLAEVVPAAIRALEFDKTMRWGSGRMRFARPIRWILASLDGVLVGFEVEGVASGLESRGHRFNHPDPFPAASWDQLLAELRARQVEPDPNLRRERVVDGARRVAPGTPELTEALVDENVFLTEWPEALCGEFPASYLDLPEAVLVTAMAKHERFFPVRDGEGKLVNAFVSIRNGGEEETVRSGNRWVLNARFNDARFFYEEDRRKTLEQFLAKTAGMTFQEKLGSIRQRADRLSELAAKVAEWTGSGPEEVGMARQAGLLAKADLASGLVGELPSLQGVIGGEYGLREGLDRDVARAIGAHYDLSRCLNPASAEQRVAACVLAADQLDKLAGYLGIGLAPSGTSDPYALRRAASMLIELAWSWPALNDCYWRPLKVACALYAKQDLPNDVKGAVASAQELFAGRYANLLREARHDLLDAAILHGEEGLNARAVRVRLRAMELAAQDSAFVQTATRPANIVAAARKKGIVVPVAASSAVLYSPYGEAEIGSEEGAVLVRALRAAEPKLQAARREESPEAMVAALRELAEPIGRFFDSTMVMVEDEDVRLARLAALDAAAELFRTAGDFTQVVVEG